MKRLISMFLGILCFVALLGCEPETENSLSKSLSDSSIYEQENSDNSSIHESITESSSVESSSVESSDYESTLIESSEFSDAQESTHECSDNSEDNFVIAPEKPVIYLYPTYTTDVEVVLDYKGVLTCTYPEYNGKWAVTASPDGTLTDKDGMEYNYLYWEGVGGFESDFSKGFCVAGDDTAAFLENALAKLGLNRREANEFIVYWLPKMQENKYNLISFQFENYVDAAKLHVSPAPDTSIRVFMSYKALDEEVNIEPQILTSPERSGFVLVEWGGTEVK